MALSKLVASMDVGSQLSVAKTDLADHRKSWTAAHDDLLHNSTQLLSAVQTVVATVQEKRSSLLARTRQSESCKLKSMYVMSRAKCRAHST